MNYVSPDQLTLEKFAAVLRTKFRAFLDPANSVELELVEAIPGRPGGPAQRPAGDRAYESFSLVFNGSGDQYLPQKTYPFEHEQIGRFDLFIVPIGKEQDAFQYQALFSRRIQSD